MNARANGATAIAAVPRLTEEERHEENSRPRPNVPPVLTASFDIRTAEDRHRHVEQSKVEQL